MGFAISENLYNLAVSCPFPLYAVGGFVRDTLRGAPLSGDVDICAPATADDFRRIAEGEGFKTEAVYSATGTVKISKGGEKYEFASFRSDEYVRGAHTPAKVTFTDDIVKDARRRDFKCNAVYYDIAAGKIADPLGGVADVLAGRLSCVREAARVFSEDGLRLMRLARQSAQTGFKPVAETLAAARENCALILDIAPERIWTELKLILSADGRTGDASSPYNGLLILSDTRVLDGIFPELTRGRGLLQRSDFHKYDVLGHSLRAVKYAPREVRLAALLHDIGKPYAFSLSGNFHRHEEYGEKIAFDALTRLKIPKRERDDTCRLVRLHMYDFRLDARENKIRALIVQNLDIFDRLLMLKQADFSACKDDTSVAPCVQKWQYILTKMREEGAPLTIKDLKVGGAALIEAGVEKNFVSGILKTLLLQAAQTPALNERERLVSAALKINSRLKKL